MFESELVEDKEDMKPEETTVGPAGSHSAVVCDVQFMKRSLCILRFLSMNHGIPF